MVHCRIIFLVFVFLRQLQAASTPTVWTTSPYLRTGSFVFTTTITGSVSQSGTVTYSSAMSAAPARRVALGYIDLEYTLPTSTFYLDLQNPVGTATASSFGYTIRANSGTSIKNLRIRYLALDQTFPHPFTFGYLVYGGGSFPDYSPFTISMKMNFTNSTGMVLNTANDNAMLIFQHTLDLYSLSKCFHMQYSISILNQSYYEALITSSCSDMELWALGASRIIFDKTSIEAGGYYYFQYGQILSVNSTPSTLTFTTSLFLNDAFMMGMKSFYITNQPKIIFSSTLGTVTSVSSSMTYRKLSFMYLSMKFRTCPGGFPYFYLLTDLCYDVCPDGTYANTALMMCTACHFSCQTCSSYPACTNCNTTNNRYQNGTSCLPMAGYFENNTAAAALCSIPLTNCSSCTSATVCTLCANGSYLASASQCLLCSNTILHCIECTSATLCTKCDTGYSLNGTISCVVAPTNVTCTDPNCLTCTTSTVCTNCSLGFTLNGTTCTNSTITCTDTNCISCPTSSSVCTNCTAGFTLNGTTCVNSTTVVTCTDANCISCSTSASTCTNCTTGFTLNGTTCVNSSTTVTCSDVNCVTCASSTVCTNCTTGFILTLGSCTANTTCTDPNCVSCVGGQSVCDNCTAGFTLSGTSCVAAPANTTCSDPKCLSCTSSTVCISCSSGFVVNGAQCRTLCGDNVLAGSQACDDGNLVDKDGCSAACQVQADFVCQPSNTTQGSTCFFTGQISINTVSINKMDGQNKLEIKLEMQPLDLQAWNQVDLKSMIKLSQPTEIVDFVVVRNPDGTVTLEVSYSGNVQSKDLVVEVDPRLSGVPSLSRAYKLSATINIVPSDNQLAYFYDDSAYSLAKVTSRVATAVGWVGLAIFFLSLICGKVVGVEMMEVLQITFFALGALTQLNPCFASLGSLWVSNGYNKIALASNSSALSDTKTPTKFKGIQMFSQSISNFNISLGLILIPLLIALICFILSKACKSNQQRSQTLKILSKKFAIQYTFTMVMFSSYLIAVCFGLQLAYGMSNLQNLLSIVSLVQCIILAGISLVYLVLIVYKPRRFGQFYKKFQAKPVYSRFYLAMMVQRWVVASCLVFGVSSKFILVSVIAICILFILICAIFRPYSKLCHNVRLGCNMLITTAIMAIFLLYGLAETNNKGVNGIFMYLPLIICLLLFACVAYSAVFIIHSIVKSIQGKKYQNFAKKGSNQIDFSSGLQSLDMNLGIDTELLTINRKLSLAPFQEQSSPKNSQMAMNLNKIKEEIRSMGIKTNLGASTSKLVQEMKFTEMQSLQVEQYGQI